MTYNPYFVVLILLCLGGGLVYYIFSRKTAKSVTLASSLSLSEIEALLDAEVSFYRQLRKEQQEIFRDRVDYFLRTVKITGEKGCVVTDTDRVLIGASATIPLFHFKLWVYQNLSEVIVYPDYFDEKFDTGAAQRNVAGMVGSGALNRKMILSQQALRQGFVKMAQGNTAIHEFVHLIDKADGEVDGVPEYLIPKELIAPWVKEMHKTIREIRTGHSDLRDYAGTNEAEFFAVVSEYFFKNPKLLQEDHPKLYDLLEKIYGQTESTL